MSSLKIIDEKRTGILEILLREIGQWSEFRRSLLDDVSPAVVHDFRVSIRRVRTALRLFTAPLPDDLSDWDGILELWFHALGHIRDIDIALDFVSSSNCAPCLELQAKLQELRSTHVVLVQRMLVDNLAFREIGDLSLQRCKLLMGPTSLEPWAQIRGARKKVLRSFRLLKSGETLAEIHRLRRRLKRLRYTVEFLASPRTFASQAYVKRLTKLQDILGAIMDSVSTRNVLVALEPSCTIERSEANCLFMKLERQIKSRMHSILVLKRRLRGNSWKRLSMSLQTPAKVCSHPRLVQLDDSW